MIIDEAGLVIVTQKNPYTYGTEKWHAWNLGREAGATETWSWIFINKIMDEPETDAPKEAQNEPILRTP
jgi:hypothetical protein